MLSIRRLTLVVLAGLLLPCLSLSAGENDTEINGLKVIPSAGKVRIEISKTGDVEFKVFRVFEPDRLVVDCVGARYDIKDVEGSTESELINKVRTSQFQTDPVNISRIVIDLKQKVDYRLFDEGDVKIVELTGQKFFDLSLPVSEKKVETAVKQEKPAEKEEPKLLPAATMGPVLPLIKPEEADTGKKEAPQADEPVVEAEKSADSPWLTETDESTPKAVNEKEKPVVVTPPVQKVTHLSHPAPSADNAAWSESYARGAPAGGGGYAMGSRKITIDAQGADIKTVLRTISDFSGVNIVAGKKVEGEVYIHIKDCPWQEALDIILKANGYGYREEFGMIRVADLTTLLKEELDIQSAEKKKEELLPLVTRIVFVNNSNAEEIKKALERMISTRGSIEVDLGSNAIVVRDIEKSVEKVSEMVRELDRRTFQVDINAKLVEVDVEAARELGINWGFLNIRDEGYDGSGSVEVDASIINPVGTVRFGTVRSWAEINVLLQMMEKSNKANIISNPRITTMDNREASILVGKEIPLIVADEAGNPVTELTKIGIMLRVTPHVNADRTITLDLHPEVSDLQSESTSQGGVIIATSEADTRVIVNDGDTAVIGGLIKKSETEVIRGIPFLKDVPYLGRLFSSKNTINKKTELVIFVTPTIVE